MPGGYPVPATQITLKESSDPKHQNTLIPISQNFELRIFGAPPIVTPIQRFREIWADWRFALRPSRPAARLRRTNMRSNVVNQIRPTVLLLLLQAGYIP